MLATKVSTNPMKPILVSLVLLISGCVNTQINSDKEALKNATRGAVGMVLLDHHMYKNAIESGYNAVTQSMLASTLLKAGILRTYEKEVGDGYTIESNLPLAKLNKLCWMGKFVQHYKNNIPAENLPAYKDTLVWLDAKQTTLLKKLNDSYSKDELGEDDCRK
ncbi:hypothetical protein [Acinetobacter seifertii]|uniref:Uncharacterized protein n=1 Tax=Acinetobacter seifertii TaxID=1530123 RepID=A0ABX8L5B4_9GAMM|nr:hypothetical protein [Acinetobacter seifertii]QXB45967.1 hypothetical protein I6L30_16355 [Acinetobacter seifertii]